MRKMSGLRGMVWSKKEKEAYKKLEGRRPPITMTRGKALQEIRNKEEALKNDIKAFELERQFLGGKITQADFVKKAKEVGFYLEADIMNGPTAHKGPTLRERKLVILPSGRPEDSKKLLAETNKKRTEAKMRKLNSIKELKEALQA